MDDTRLFDDNLVPVSALWGDSPEKRFWRFHKKHPEVYDQLVTMTREAKLAGRTKIGIKMLFEVLRWERIITGLPDQDEGFKLNNNYAPRYARLIMDRNPDLAGMFNTREMQT